MNARSKFTTKHYEPDRNHECVCGSGAKFKKCCLDKYSAESFDEYKSAIHRSDYREALEKIRNHLTWYVLSHKAHTLFIMAVSPEEGEKLLKIDIDSLSGILEKKHHCYRRLGMGKEFVTAAKKLTNAINDQRWRDKISFYISLCYSLDHGDDILALATLSDIDINTCTDIDILTLYIQLNNDQVGLPRALTLIERVIENTEKDSIKIQYRGLKAVKYYLIGQDKEANKILQEAIAVFRELPESRKSTYGRWHYALALELYGKLNQSNEHLLLGRDTVLQLINDSSDERFTAEYRSDLHYQLGDFEESLNRHSEAITAYTRSLAEFPKELTKVFLARSICNGGDCDKARRTLEQLREEELNKAGHFDLAISWAILASSTRSRSDIEIAKTKLRIADTNDPIFIQMRDKWIIELLETTPQSQQGKFHQFLKLLSRYATLNPNFFGIGVNLNQIINDMEGDN